MRRARDNALVSARGGGAQVIRRPPRRDLWPRPGLRHQRHPLHDPSVPGRPMVRDRSGVAGRRPVPPRAGVPRAHEKSSWTRRVGCSCTWSLMIAYLLSASRSLWALSGCSWAMGDLSHNSACPFGWPRPPYNRSPDHCPETPAMDRETFDATIRSFRHRTPFRPFIRLHGLRPREHAWNIKHELASAMGATAGAVVGATISCGTMWVDGRSRSRKGAGNQAMHPAG
jgi:hypothetical protein